MMDINCNIDGHNWVPYTLTKRQDAFKNSRNGRIRVTEVTCVRCGKIRKL